MSSSLATVTFTFIRHGESTDNLKNLWAGWKDAPLSNHGMNQARALGEFFAANTRFSAMHASPLKRAFWTAQAVRDAQPEPEPLLTPSPLLRERHWGIAEGKPWIMETVPGLSLEEHFARGLYPVILDRSHKFPEGESMDDLAARADQAVKELLMPHIWQAAREGKTGVHVAIVSHGVFISELVPALLVRDASGVHPGHKYKGLLNTAWTRIIVTVRGAKEGERLEFQDDPPLLEVKVTDFNRHEHLDSIARQRVGIGSAGYDPKQQDIRSFFGGGMPTEEGRSSSNACDETAVQD